MGMDLYSLIDSVAERGLKNQVPGPKDFYRDDLLFCGVCGKPRQMMKEFPRPTDDDPDAKKVRKVAVLCACEMAAEQEEKRKEQARQDMEALARLRKASLMDDRFSNATFRNYEVTPQNERNLKLCRSYVARFDEMLKKNQGLLFYGPVGTGKSYTAACIANALLKRKVPVVMTSLIRLMEMIQRGDTEESTILNRLGRAKLVIFDDLGAERSTDYALERVYSIIDDRYRKRLPMILTTNLTIDQMKKEQDIRYSRIYDRLFECCYPMQFTGVSFRKKSANQRFEHMKQLLDD